MEESVNAEKVLGTWRDVAVVVGPETRPASWDEDLGVVAELSRVDARLLADTAGFERQYGTAVEIAGSLRFFRDHWLKLGSPEEAVADAQERLDYELSRLRAATLASLEAQRADIEWRIENLKRTA